MKILIVGNGGREHALCWKVAQSARVDRVFVADGNAGTACEPKTENINIAPTAIDELVHFAKKNAIDLTIVGPEAPMALGIADAFAAAQLSCFAPSQHAAQLESSKIFCKQLMTEYHIPTAHAASFDSLAPALAYMQAHSFPQVIKADGLAAGKGVVIAADLNEAKQAITEMLEEKKFGMASRRILIETFLTGEELSFMAIVSGDDIVPLASSQDHKRRDDGNQGPNTGGMGAYSPAPLLTPALEKKVMEKIMRPTVAALKSRGIIYFGFLYAGLMITPDGEPKVLEFNCRLGDPETQPILFRLQSDLVELCLAAMEHQLYKMKILWDPRPALSVVLASGGYPDAYEAQYVIQGLAPTGPDSKIFHAGTQYRGNEIITTGGRVLAVTARGASLHDAHKRAYQIADSIHWPKRFFRHDIGHRALSGDQL